jgi:DNA-binding NarL/FixJ family response regulator/GAF domain-containing protein
VRLFGTVQDVTRRKEAELRLERQLRIEAGLTRCSQELLIPVSSEGDLRRVAAPALEHLRSALEIDQAFLMRLVPDPDDPYLTMAAFATVPVEIEAHEHPLSRRFPLSLLLPVHRQLLEAGRPVPGPPKRSEVRTPEQHAWLDMEAARTRITFPVRIDGKLWGMLGFNGLAEREWSEEEQMVLIVCYPHRDAMARPGSKVDSLGGTITLETASLGALAAPLLTQRRGVALHRDELPSDSTLLAKLCLADASHLLLVPLTTSAEHIGLLVLATGPDARSFNANDQSLAETAAGQIATAITNVRLAEQARRAAMLAERNRVARDLHDSATQALYSLSLLAGGWAMHAEQGRLDEVPAKLTQLGAIALQVLKELRLLIYELRHPELVEAGLVKALEERLAAVEQRANVRTSLDVSGDLIGLPPDHDVVLMDLKMPKQDGLEAMRQIHKALLEARCIILTSFTDDQQVLDAVEAGAMGFLNKDAHHDELLAAIRAVSQGDGAPQRGKRHADRERAEGAPAAVQRLLEPRPGSGAGGLGTHGDHPRAQHSRQAPAGQPHPGGPLCPRAQAGRAAEVSLVRSLWRCSDSLIASATPSASSPTPLATTSTAWTASRPWRMGRCGGPSRGCLSTAARRKFR